jgi:hypothetical protein
MPDATPPFGPMGLEALRLVWFSSSMESYQFRAYLTAYKRDVVMNGK